MDNYITNWEMNQGPFAEAPREEIATDPMEPYTLDWNNINWN
jgi:hypothetical protein